VCRQLRETADGDGDGDGDGATTRTAASRAEPSDRQVLLIVSVEAGEAESTDCVDRHILFITPLIVLSTGRSPSRPPCPRAPAHLSHEQQPRRSPTGQKTRVLLLVQGVLVACGRARARGGQRGARTERERRQLKEGKLEVLVVSKDTGRVVLRSRTCSAPFTALARTH